MSIVISRARIVITIFLRRASRNSCG